MLPTVEERVYRPRSRPNHGQCGPKNRQYDRKSCSRGYRQSDPGLNASYEDSGNRSPQTGNQQNARERSNAFLDRMTANRWRRKAGNVAVNQCGSDQEPLNQETFTRPAVRKCGE